MARLFLKNILRRTAQSLHHALSVVVVLTWFIGPACTALGQDSPHLHITPSPTSSFIPLGEKLQSAQTTIITRQELESRGVATVAEALEHVPSLHLDRSAGGSISSPYLRGAEPNFTLVLIDGIKVNDPTNSRGGSYDLTTINIESVERIEVVRGPLSLLYGSDALGGIIQIITSKRAAAHNQELSLTLGNNTQASTSALVSHSTDAHSFSLGVGYADIGETREGSSLSSNYWNSHYVATPSSHSQLALTARVSETNALAFPDDSGGKEFASLQTREKRESSQLQTGVEYTSQISDKFSFALTSSYAYDTEDTLSPGVLPGIRDSFGIPASDLETSFQRAQFAERTVFTVSPEIFIAAGGDISFESGSSEGDLIFGSETVPTDFNQERLLGGLYQELLWEISNELSFLGGMRVDFPERAATQFIPRIGLSYNLSATGTTVQIQWGEGYKLPSFFALAHPFVGNPDLLPETSRGGEISMSQTFLKDILTTELILFTAQYKNAVDLEEGPPIRLVNRDEITADGVECILKYRISSQIQLASHVSFVETDIQETEEELRNRPEWLGGAVIDYSPLPRLQINLSGLYVGKRLDSSIPTGDQELSSYSRLDLTTAWVVAQATKITFRLRNLLSQDYDEAIGSPAPQLTGEIGIRVGF